jgi:hypothetical protein
MRIARFGHGRESEIPTSWSEAEAMIAKAMRFHQGRGRNLNLQSVCARIAYGLCCGQSSAADPTEALALFMREICRREGAELDGSEEPRKRA